jgi:hypothetical protein
MEVGMRRRTLHLDHALQAARSTFVEPPMSIEQDTSRVATLTRRARRLARKGEYRKAALALRERVMLAGDAASWVTLGDMLRRARRLSEAIDALHQGLYLHRQAGAMGRVRTVARMIVALDPWDAKAARYTAVDVVG